MHRIGQGPRDIGGVGLASDVYVSPVHIVQAVEGEDAQAVADQDVLKARVQQQARDTSATRASAIDDDADGLRVFANQLERVVQAAQDSGSLRMLFGMQDGNIGGQAQVLRQRKTARRSDTAEADAAKGGAQGYTRADHLLDILCVQRD